MRSPKSRSRSKSNRNRSVGNVVNRVFDSSGPEGKVRGTPQQIIDKYNQLARDAQLSNDGVAAENFQQHAEHYTRLLSEAMREAEARREQHEAQQQANRERNAQRHRDHDKQGGNGGAPQPAAPAAENAPQPDLGMAAAPDVIDLDQGGDSGLVETPESKPRKTRSRKPKAAADKAQKTSSPDPQPDPASAASDASEAAE